MTPLQTVHKPINIYIYTYSAWCHFLLCLRIVHQLALGVGGRLGHSQNTCKITRSHAKSSETTSELVISGDFSCISVNMSYGWFYQLLSIGWKGIQCGGLFDQLKILELGEELISL